ncbi:MAG: 2-amino-4-hydroxy-6-hydroxymethyldihydropteridine diphosphokinase [Gemmataceae bacterium]
MSTPAFIALGSNLGDRSTWIARAVQALAQSPGVHVQRCSTLFETEPVGGPAGQSAYLNGALEVETTLTPRELLALLLRIEADLGRERTVPSGPRIIDLDLLLYGKTVLNEPDLIVPHPRLHERLFVLMPLAQVASGVVHPVLGQSIGQLLASLLTVAPVGRHPGRELAGLRALVTGSTSGIGRATALALAERGADVMVHGRRSLARAEDVAAQITRQGVRSVCLLADLREPVGCEQLVERSWATWNGLDILINNAGTDTLTGEASAWSFERKLSELWQVDVQATIALSRHLGRRMREAGGGVILNMGWDQAETGMEGDSGELFATVKGAVMAFSRSLALSLAPLVRVHCLAPGWIRTAWGDGASTVWQERVRRETPLGVWGRPEDVAETACWLCSPGANYLTGQIIRVNGGAVR